VLFLTVASAAAALFAVGAPATLASAPTPPSLLVGELDPLPEVEPLEPLPELVPLEPLPELGPLEPLPELGPLDPLPDPTVGPLREMASLHAALAVPRASAATPPRTQARFDTFLIAVTPFGAGSVTRVESMLSTPRAALPKARIRGHPCVLLAK